MCVVLAKWSASCARFWLARAWSWFHGFCFAGMTIAARGRRLSDTYGRDVRQAFRLEDNTVVYCDGRLLGVHGEGHERSPPSVTNFCGARVNCGCRWVYGAAASISPTVFRVALKLSVNGFHGPCSSTASRRITTWLTASAGTVAYAGLAARKSCPATSSRSAASAEARATRSTVIAGAARESQSSMRCCARCVGLGLRGNRGCMVGPGS